MGSDSVSSTSKTSQNPSSSADSLANFKKFTSWIQSRFFQSIIESEKDRAAVEVLDLAPRRGCNFFNWKTCKVVRVVSVNRTEEDSERCQRRLRSLDETAETLVADFVVTDACKDLLNPLLRQSQETAATRMKFDVVFAGFELHRAFKNVHKVRTFLSNVVAHLSPGGSLIGVLMSDNQIMRRLHRKRSFFLLI